MNSREHVRAALSGQVPDRIPKTFTFWEASLPDIAPLSPSDYFDLDVRFVDIKPPAGQEDFLRYLGSLPHDLHLGSLAQLRSYYEWNYHPESVAGSSPLGQIQTAEDLERVILPDSIDPSRYADLSGQVEDWHARGLAVAASPPHLGGQLFEMAYRLRGFEPFLTDLKHRRPVAQYLLDQLTALMVHAALILARAGVDILLLDDDVAMPTDLIISPGLWREVFKPRLADVIQLRRARRARPCSSFITPTAISPGCSLIWWRSASM